MAFLRPLRFLGAFLGAFFRPAAGWKVAMRPPAARSFRAWNAARSSRKASAEPPLSGWAVLAVRKKPCLIRLNSSSRFAHPANGSASGSSPHTCRHSARLFVRCAAVDARAPLRRRGAIAGAGRGRGRGGLPRRGRAGAGAGPGGDR